MLAGGLTEANVAEAVARIGAAAVDVSSGVEERPGHKTPERVQRFLVAVSTLALPREFDRHVNASARSPEHSRTIPPTVTARKV
jgi:N-(5'phosphoribosyl)anthranilate (PRA) isomerase